MEGDNVLPDFRNEKMTEQLVFEAKVRRSNIEFRRRKEDIIRFMLSNPECRLYPQSAKEIKELLGKRSKGIHTILRRSSCSRKLYVTMEWVGFYFNFHLSVLN